MTTFDVLIAGGGPGGATLAALLRKKGLHVAVFEAAQFPRDHIGESFTQRLTTVLQESGALDKVLKSQCYVPKYGGYYAWGNGDPAVSLFEHDLWVGSSRVDLQACKLEYSIVSPK